MFGTFRTLLALMVVAQHIGGIPFIGAYAVFGFYVLSGYLMTLIMQENYGYTRSGMLTYALNRFLRIYPLYWAAIAFSLVLILALGEPFSSKFHRSLFIPADLPMLLKNLFLFFPHREIPRLSPAAWALTVELFYYLAIGLGLSRNRKLSVCWFIAAAAYHPLVAALGYDWNHRYFTIPAAAMPFATGALIYHYRSALTGCIDRAERRLGGYLPHALFLCLLLNWLCGYATKSFMGVLFYANYAACALMVAALSGRKTLPRISKRFDKWLGDFSYPIYLIHFQAAMITFLLLDAAGFEYGRPHRLLFLASIPLLFLLSWALTVSVERPVEALRTRIKGKASPAKT